MRGATIPHCHNSEVLQFQSTLLVRGATSGLCNDKLTKCISIHAPRERSDHEVCGRSRRKRYFNPRSSWEERPQALRWWRRDSDFNPRSSWEERLLDIVQNVIIKKFQSTLLVRGATPTLWITFVGNGFQSTLLVRGATHSHYYNNIY